MTKNIREMTPDEIMSIPTLGLDDEINVDCKACGKCCKNRHDIILTPYDVYRISTYLGRTPMEVIKRYCEVYIAPTSKLPVVRVLPLPPKSACPFLHRKKCSIHSKKPVVCKVFPLARLYFADGDGTSKYCLSETGCGQSQKKITVREWIGDLASEEAEKAGKAWLDILVYLVQIVEKMSILPEDVRGLTYDTIFAALYINYDIEKPFIQTLDYNFNNLKMILRKLEKCNETKQKEDI